jgi:hypothetical protein
LVDSLHALPEVAKVEYTGAANAPLVVVHFLDWHFVPPDLCKLDGIDFEANNAAVEKVQDDQLAIARYLIREHGLQDVYHEGVTEQTLPDLRVRLDLLKTLDRLAALGGMDEAARRHRREQTLIVGAPGRLLHSGEIGAVRILEDEVARDAAAPIAGPFAMRFDPETLDARRKTMVAHLPTSGLLLVVLGGSHDLRAYLGAGAVLGREPKQPTIYKGGPVAKPGMPIAPPAARIPVSASMKLLQLRLKENNLPAPRWF